jgi:hypothetical protein
VNRAAFANPGGVRGVVVEENARVVGEALGVGSAGGRVAGSGTHGVESGAEGRARDGGWQNSTGGRETSAAAVPGEFAGAGF